MRYILDELIFVISKEIECQHFAADIECAKSNAVSYLLKTIRVIFVARLASQYQNAEIDGPIPGVSIYCVLEQHYWHCFSQLSCLMSNRSEHPIRCVCSEL